MKLKKVPFSLSKEKKSFISLHFCYFHVKIRQRVTSRSAAGYCYNIGYVIKHRNSLSINLRAQNRVTFATTSEVDM